MARTVQLQLDLEQRENRRLQKQINILKGSLRLKQQLDMAFSQGPPPRNRASMLMRAGREIAERRRGLPESVPVPFPLHERNSRCHATATIQTSLPKGPPRSRAMRRRARRHQEESRQAGPP